jgi:hypothetical protein
VPESARIHVARRFPLIKKEGWLERNRVQPNCDHGAGERAQVARQIPFKQKGRRKLDTSDDISTFAHGISALVSA